MTFFISIIIFHKKIHRIFLYLFFSLGWSHFFIQLLFILEMVLLAFTICIGTYFYIHSQNVVSLFLSDNKVTFTTKGSMSQEVFKSFVIFLVLYSPLPLRGHPQDHDQMNRPFETCLCFKISNKRLSFDLYIQVIRYTLRNYR